MSDLASLGIILYNVIFLLIVITGMDWLWENGDKDFMPYGSYLGVVKSAVEETDYE